jgi:hypothetical protein
VAELTRRCQSAIAALGGSFPDAWKQIVGEAPTGYGDALAAWRARSTNPEPLNDREEGS